MSYYFKIENIEYVLGENKIDLSKLIENYEKTILVTGIENIYETEKNSTELAILAAQKILKNTKIQPRALIYVTQSQDYVLPGSATIIHERLNLPSDCMTLDINSGCSGFAQALLLSSQIIKEYEYILIICSDTYRKKVDKSDRSTFSVFSDGASAVLVSNEKKIHIKNKYIQTVGSGKKMLFQEYNKSIKMSGRELWDFTRQHVVPDINSLININNITGDKNKLNIFMHQASKLVVEGISKELQGNIKIFKNYQNVGNTVSSSIPILIKESCVDINECSSIISGFGVGIMSYNLLLTN
jgi:3-oxoacyl-[acyl-carrier-protein] synthase-3